MTKNEESSDSALVKLRQDLKNIFNDSQRLKNTRKSVKSFMKIYEQWFRGDQFENFMQSFVTLIKSVLLCNRSSPFTKRSLEFLTLLFKEISLFEEEQENERLQNLAAREANGDVSVDASELYDEIGNELFDQDQTIINKRYVSPPSTVDIFIRMFLLKFLDADDVNIRSNTASLIKKILECLDEIDEDTYKEIINKLIRRSFDKDKMVRALVILCFRKLQNVIDEDDQAISTLKYHLNVDPDSFVRACVLKIIGVFSDTLPDIFLATRDCNQAVRRGAYTKIAENCGVIHFSPSDRHKLLKNGFGDVESSVKDVILKKLIPNWISDLDNDMIKFLEYLNIKNDIEFYNNLFASYFSTLLKSIEKDDITFLHRFIFNFKEQYLDKYKLLTKVALTEENTYLWYRLCCFCKENNIHYKKLTESVGIEEQSNDDFQLAPQQNFILVDLLDDILPDIPVFCDYIEGFVNRIITNINDSSSQSQNPDRIEEKNFIFNQLLQIGGLYKIKDTAQWNRILKTFKSIILNDDLYLIFDDYIEPIFVIFNNYFEDNHEKLLDLTLDLINTINVPEIHCDETQTQSEEEQIGIQQQTDETLNTKSSQELLSQERMKLDHKILERCINICNSFLHVDKPKKSENLSVLPGLISKLVLPNLAYKDSEKIRTLSIKALGNYCFASMNAINAFLKIFVEIVEEENYLSARVEALKFLFDFVGYHGLQKLNFLDLTKDSDNSTRLNTTDFRYQHFLDFFTDTINKFLSEPTLKPEFMKKNLKTRIEYELFDLSVRGVSKILFLGRFHSSDFLAKLIIIYVTYKNITMELKQYIKIFFYRYAEHLPSYQKYFNLETNPYTDAYVECCKTLMDNSNNGIQEYEIVSNIVKAFTKDEHKNQLLLKAMEIFTLTSDKELIVFNLKFISRFIEYQSFKKEELYDLMKQFDQFRQRYSNQHRLRDENKARNDKAIGLFDKLITNIKLYLQDHNRSTIVQDDDDEGVNVDEQQQERGEEEEVSTQEDPENTISDLDED